MTSSQLVVYPLTVMRSCEVSGDTRVTTIAWLIWLR